MISMTTAPMDVPSAEDAAGASGAYQPPSLLLPAVSSLACA